MRSFILNPEQSAKLRHLLASVSTHHANACDPISVQRAQIPANTPARFNAHTRRPQAARQTFVYAHAGTHGFRYPNAFRTQG